MRNQEKNSSVNTEEEKVRQIVRECMEYNPNDVEGVQDALVQNGMVFSLGQTRRLMHFFDPLNDGNAL